MGIPDHLTSLLRNLYAGQEVTVRTVHGITDWFQIRKGVRQGVYCHLASLTYIQSGGGGGVVTKSCPTLSDPMDCSPPGSSIHGILQARVLEFQL